MALPNKDTHSQSADNPMCILTVALGSHPDYPFILTHNRDEKLARVTTPPAVEGDVLCGRDKQSGGTWLGVNVRTAAIAALTNVRAAQSQLAARSRGELVMRTLDGDAEAATSSDAYENYNLLHGKLSADGAPPTLHFTVAAPPNQTPRTQVLPASTPFIGVKSNDTGGGWTVAESDVDDETTWPKCAWLREKIAAALAADSVQAARGEAGAREVLLGALSLPISATCMEYGSAHAARAAHAAPSQWSPCTALLERELQRAPCLLPPFALRNHDLGGVLPTDAYGCVSQTVLVQCKSERCLLYAYRETASAAAAPAPGAAEAAIPQEAGRKRTCSEHAAGTHQDDEAAAWGPWRWWRVELPAAEAQANRTDERPRDGD